MLYSLPPLSLNFQKTTTSYPLYYLYSMRLVSVINFIILSNHLPMPQEGMFLFFNLPYPFYLRMPPIDISIIFQPTNSPLNGTFRNT